MMRISALAMSYWAANVDFKKLNEFRETQPMDKILLTRKGPCGRTVRSQVG